MEYKKMRRIEKKLTDNKSLEVIAKAKYGVLSLSDENTPYGVPLSHAISGKTIYFHCANEGLKLDIIAKNPKGHFVFVSKSKTMAKQATVDYNSAMAYGNLRIVETPDERKAAFSAITQKYMKNFPKEALSAIKKSGAKTTLVAMDIEGISGKGANKSKKKKSIASTITINNFTIKNRIVMPPLVRLNQKRSDGVPIENDFEHYSARAKNETGMIVVEATAVDENGFSFKNGLKLWDDSHISQFKKLAKSIKKHSACALVQLQHGGFKSDKSNTKPVSSSKYKDSNYSAKALSTKEADALVESFAQAALRAQKAGFDGIQLHGCHGYLINQFSCPKINKRKDKYKKSSAFGVAIIKRIKQLCNEDFLITVRIGIDSPDVKNSLKTAVDYQNAGAHMLSVSAGIFTKPYKAPKSWKFSDISHLAYLVKQKVDIPVVAVYGITDRKTANALIKNDYCDMVAVGRNHLIHDDWAKRALNNEEISKCKKCSKCYFFGTMKKCPAIESAKKKGLYK